MTRNNGLVILILMLVATHAEAYGGGDNSRSGSVNTPLRQTSCRLKF